jgi:hypothetical protein
MDLKDIEYKKKYLKYKEKYLNLKNSDSKKLHGGLGSNRYFYWNQHPDYRRLNMENLNNIIAYTGNNYGSEQNLQYLDELSNLLKITDETKEINIDFINNFHTHIYYDRSSLLDIRINRAVKEPTASFLDNNNYKYVINKIIDKEKIIILFLEEKPELINPDTNIAHNAVLNEMLVETDTKNVLEPPLEILKVKQEHRTPVFLKQDTTIVPLAILSEKKKLDKKVLKIFNDIDVNIDEIKNYLSLEITETIKTNTKSRDTLRPGHVNLLKENFEICNFNMKKSFMCSQNVNGDENNNIFPYCRTNDAINDYIINLIIQRISIDKKIDNDLKFVKYHNIFVTRVNGVYRYCILMDMKTCDLKEYIDRRFIELSADDKKRGIVDIFNKIVPSLKILKEPAYLFTHTDMKKENIFVDIMETGDDIFYLADFDKSSIYYHGIRFFNDIRTSRKIYSFATSLTDPITSYIGSKGFTDEYTNEDKYIRNFNFNAKKPHYYKISRTLSSSMDIDTEYEELYMRYNFTPYYISWDYVSLILSFFNSYVGEDNTNKLIDDIQPYNRDLKKSTIVIYQTFSKYIARESISRVYNLYLGLHSYDGDFGKLLSPLVKPTGKSMDISFIQEFEYDDYIYIDRLYLTPYNKIGLSFCFVPVLQTNTDNNNFIKINIKDSKKIFGTNSNYEHAYSFFEKNEKFIIIYSGDFTFSLHLPNYMMKTNMYSQTTAFLWKIVKEWDSINDIDIFKIIEFFSTYDICNKYKEYVPKDPEENISEFLLYGREIIKRLNDNNKKNFEEYFSDNKQNIEIEKYLHMDLFKSIIGKKMQGDLMQNTYELVDKKDGECEGPYCVAKTIGSTTNRKLSNIDTEDDECEGYECVLKSEY